MYCFSVKSRRSSTQSQHHQSAAKDLTSTTEPESGSSSPTQTTYLTSTVQQRSRRPRHFLELKTLKDNYNTLDSTLWNVFKYTQRKGQVVLPLISAYIERDSSCGERTKTLPLKTNMYCLMYRMVHIRLLVQCSLPKCSLCLYPMLLHVWMLCLGGKDNFKITSVIGLIWPKHRYWAMQWHIITVMTISIYCTILRPMQMCLN